MDRRAVLIIGLAELAALAIGVVLCLFGVLAWYLVPLALLVPPAVLVIAVIAAFTATTRDGGNPFQ
jgi:hypothetical protein